MKKGIQKRLIIILALAAAVLIGIIVIFAWYNSPTQKVQRLLDLGQQYLMAENYEQAISMYDEILAIDPKNEQALKGEADAYVAWADTVYSEGDIDKSIEILARGFEKTSYKEISVKLSEREEEQQRLAEKERSTEESEDAFETATLGIEGNGTSGNSSANVLAVYEELNSLFISEDYEGIRDYVLQDSFMESIEPYKDESLALWDYEEFYFFNADGIVDAEESAVGDILVVYWKDTEELFICRQGEKNTYGLYDSVMYGDQEVDVSIRTGELEMYFTGDTMHTFYEGSEDIYSISENEGVTVWHM